MNSVTDLFINENVCPDLDISNAAKHLSEALQCITVNDRKHYEEFEHLQSYMKQNFPHVMAAGTFELVKHSVLITLPGTNPALQPCLFMAHQDVVPVVSGTEKDWKYPAFSGKIAEGSVWGRGALDIKEMVFGELEAAEYLLSHGESFKRTVYLAFGEDEETFNTGAQAISDLLKSRGIKLDFLLDEGGGMIESAASYGAPETLISPITLMEKGYADLELSVKSRGGHSSRPYGGTSLGRLSCAIAQIVENPFAFCLSPVMKQLFSVLQPYITQEPLHTLVQDMDGNADKIAAYCIQQKDIFQFFTTTIAPTIIRGSSAACNVMPQNMEAVINFRLAETETIDSVMEHCKTVVKDKSVEMRYLQANNPSVVARSDGYGYQMLTNTLHKYLKDVVFVPGISAGATDAHCYEQICDTCLRFSPFFAEPEDIRTGEHGTNEHLTIRAYAHGIRILIDFMTSTCIYLHE